MELKAELDFNRDIRPILADKCFACHGPDAAKRKAKLRLDTREGATADLGGRAAIVPGNAAGSEIVRRIFSSDPDESMPPSDGIKRLAEAEKQTLVAWVNSGAPYANHWVYAPPKRSEIPPVKNALWTRNAIDHFILARLEREKLTPSPEADRRILLRRLSQDLTGLPPDSREVGEFLSETKPDAYERAVDRLLSSPHYGERMAMYWLDLVRYADTVGYHGDQTHHIWPYRDYVITALNQNKPFDEFTAQQLAGDLLSPASLENKIASGFNRLNMTTEEGGAQDAEYLAKYTADRVRCVSTAWMGATLGCAECHDHKFDPYTAADFYRFGAFFADLKELGAYKGGNGSRPPEMPVPTPRHEEELRRLETALAAAEKDLDKIRPRIAIAQAAWENSHIIDSQGRHTAAWPKAIAKLLAIDPSARTDLQREEITDWFAGKKSEFANIWKRHKDLRAEMARLQSDMPRTMISVSVTPRVTRVLHRGDWMDATGAVVEPSVPHFLPHSTAPDRRATRLDLARWLASPENPMTARVFVNRLWKLLFGAGLSRVLDDLGTQGEPPTHPELVDFLALEFVQSGWNIKHITRLMVTSASYRQSSLTRPDVEARDPSNRLLARQSRFRLPAEMVRDHLLKFSGLLTTDIGGPSAKPYQPEGYWDYLNFPKREYHPDKGRNQYRRGVYTHWQRLFLHPMLKAFDAPSREECAADRPVSNTPLATLALLNDPTFVEAARALAESALRDRTLTTSERIAWIYRQTLHRDPLDDESSILAALYHADVAEFQKKPSLASKLISTGFKPVADSSLDRAQLAAWTSVCRAVLNLHETIVRF